GKRKKYYLAHSFRDGKRVKKVSFYLGANLSLKEIALKRKHAEKVIEERIRALEIIRDPFHTVLSSKEIEGLKNIGSVADIRIMHLSDDEWRKFTKAFTYDTNAIEGSRVTASEVERILDDDLLPSGRDKYDISETYGVSLAVEHIRKTDEHISLDLIKKLHEIVFKDSKPFAGNFREKGVEVAVVDGAGNVVHRGAPSENIIPLLDELVGWYNENRDRYTPIVLAAVVHNQFENVHPFQDGNGRVGRILLNNILIKHDLLPVNIEMKNRAEYYRVLQEYENNQNLGPTIELIIREYKALGKMIKR
ncbi:MAG: Fic family protein, partial [archaeon]